MTKRILRLPSVKSLTGLSRSTIYLRISQGKFPQPIALGGRTVGWIEEEIDNWLDEAIDQRERLNSGNDRRAK
ncbi:helix-turn-helix transcriptional regulator [Marinobacter salicampi]|uniref:helix-turn-helix transcriptional regulator n=1 Tax=Marinobacter salicampi TaxID=435907 RepID=UPI00140D2BDE|nr:AlpA family transcriptional regulator [Marinobacter salicampi]